VAVISATVQVTDKSSLFAPLITIMSVNPAASARPRARPLRRDVAPERDASRQLLSFCCRNARPGAPGTRRHRILARSAAAPVSIKVAYRTLRCGGAGRREQRLSPLVASAAHHSLSSWRDYYVRNQKWR
jgi:hypothetical protein